MIPFKADGRDWYKLTSKHNTEQKDFPFKLEADLSLM